MAHALADAEADRAMHFGKGYVPPRPAPDAADLPLQVSLDEFLDAACALPAPPERRPHRAPMRTITVDEKIELWFETLKRKARTTLQEFVRRWTNRMHAIMSFLACLELAKRGQVELRQERHFGPLWVYPGEDDADR